MASEELCDWITDILNIYKEAATSNPSKACLEVCIPLKSAIHTLVEFDSVIMRACLCTFSKCDWWNFQMLRLMAMSKILSTQAGASPISHFIPEALTLTAACVWLINSLHSHHNDSSATRQLMQAALPLTEADGTDLDVLLYQTSTCSRRWNGSDDDNDSDNNNNRVIASTCVIPHVPDGVIFLCRIVLADASCLWIGGVTLNESAFKFFFKMTPEAFEAKYRRTGIVNKNYIATVHFPTSKQRSVPYIASEVHRPPLFNFAAQGITLPPPVIDDHSNNDDCETPPHEEQEPPTIDEELTDLWRRFVIGITCKSPDPKDATKPSYLMHDEAEYKTYSEDIYKSLHLSDIWTDVYYKRGSLEDWKWCFDHMFPPLSKVISSKSQNYPGLNYYKTWNKLVEHLQGEPATIETIQTELFHQL
ncbi:hypothetical protein AN958_08084 [Leucoagaricus sp. SymC.cos]|nr:hypothetical protein AN958_08084 [Leucoagaricus sp. SymC.cos]